MRPGAADSFLFWSAWGAHAGATMFTLQDAHGPVRRGLFLASCSGLGLPSYEQPLCPAQPAGLTVLSPMSGREGGVVDE